MYVYYKLSLWSMVCYIFSLRVNCRMAIHISNCIPGVKFTTMILCLDICQLLQNSMYKMYPFCLMSKVTFIIKSPYTSSVYQFTWNYGKSRQQSQEANHFTEEEWPFLPYHYRQPESQGLQHLPSCCSLLAGSIQQRGPNWKQWTGDPHSTHIQEGFHQRRWTYSTNAYRWPISVQ